jgi:hypothetical protein
MVAALQRECAWTGPGPRGFWGERFHFVSESNIPIPIAASYSFRSVSQTAFRNRFHSAIQTLQADVDPEFKNFCPQKKVNTLRESFMESITLD